jgi:hypothetical protein
MPFDDAGNRNILIQFFPAQGRSVCAQCDLLELLVNGAWLEFFSLPASFSSSLAVRLGHGGSETGIVQ